MKKYLICQECGFAMPYEDDLYICPECGGHDLEEADETYG